MEIYSGDLKLTGDTQFTSDWNYISGLFQTWKETDKDEDFDNYFNAKLCLEQGLPIARVL